MCRGVDEGAIKHLLELKLNQEYPEPNERETVRLLAEILREVIQQPFLTGLAYRDGHVKGHAAVRATVA